MNWTPSDETLEDFQNLVDAAILSRAHKFKADGKPNENPVTFVFEEYIHNPLLASFGHFYLMENALYK